MGVTLSFKVAVASRYGAVDSLARPTVTLVSVSFPNCYKPADIVWT
jgi:hypothetical protein